jgi:hypothetical protein
VPATAVLIADSESSGPFESARARIRNPKKRITVVDPKEIRSGRSSSRTCTRIWQTVVIATVNRAIHMHIDREDLFIFGMVLMPFFLGHERFFSLKVSRTIRI